MSLPFQWEMPVSRLADQLVAVLLRGYRPHLDVSGFIGRRLSQYHAAEGQRQNDTETLGG